MSSQPAKLFVVQKTPPEPSEKLIQRALENCIITEACDFVNDLATARAVFKKYPELVKSDHWEPLWVQAFKRTYGFHPAEVGACDIRDREQLRLELRVKAEDTARAWMTNGVAEKIAREEAERVQRRSERKQRSCGKGNA